MAGIKGGYIGGGGSSKADICQDPCDAVNPCQNVAPAPAQCIDADPCQNVTPVPAQCKEIVDPCQDNQSGGSGGGFGGIGGQGGQVSQGGIGAQVSYGGPVGVKK